MAPPHGVLSLPFVRAVPPTTAANYSGATYSELDTFLTIAAVLACTGIAVIILQVISICRRRRSSRRPHRVTQEPSTDEIVESIPWDEIRIIVELAEKGCRGRVQKIPVTVYSREGGEAEECAICLEELEEGEEVKVMPRCRHTFHGDCIDQWLGVRSASCPVCRDVIAEKERRRDDVVIDIPMHDLSRDEI